MTPPAGWQKGSFRGVAFVTDDHEQGGGRRLVTHEFPQGEKPVLEDLGGKAQRFTVNCHILGSLAAANAFATALLAPGIGTLIHPWLGSMQVGVDDFSRSDSTSEGGLSTFSVSFVESGLPAVPQPAADTASIARATSAAKAAAAPGLFSGSFSVAGATAFVEDAASRLIGAAALATSIQGGLLGGAGPALRTFQAGLASLGGGALLARQPLALGISIVGMVQTLSALGGSNSARIAAFGTLMDFGGALDPVIGETPARALQRDNQAAFVQLVNLAAASALVATVAGASFASYQDAVVIRDRAADALDRLSLRQADLGYDAGAAAYDDLRRALVRDVTARGGTLARLQGYTPAVAEPALVIAHRLYADPAAVEDRAAEIVARNHVAHPGFLPGGQPLQVLTPDVVGASS
ncbi:DNA circularization N-terminal domain-containing protein [soil metagenome]